MGGGLTELATFELEPVESAPRGGPVNTHVIVSEPNGKMK